MLLRAGDESPVNDKGGQPRIKSGQRKRCTLQGTQAPVCCCLLGHGLCKPAFPKVHPASHYICIDKLHEAMCLAQAPVLGDKLPAKPTFLQSSSRKHRSKHPISTRFCKDQFCKTRVFVAGAWVLALLKRNRKSFFFF